MNMPKLSHKGLSFITKGPRVPNMSKQMQPRVLLSIAFVAFLLLPASTLAEHKEQDGMTSPMVSFDQSHGEHYDELMHLNGTADRPLQQARWSILNISLFDQREVIQEGEYLTSVTPAGDHQWRWSLVVDVSSLDCTCVVEIDLHNGPEAFTSQLIVYLGNLSHRPVLSEPMLSTYTLTEGEMEVPFNAVTPSGDLNGSVLSVSLCEAPTSVCLAPLVPFTLDVYFDQDVRIKLNSTTLDLPDGFWKFHLEMEDRMLNPSNPVSFTLQLDRQAPIVTLSTTLQNNEVSTSIDSETAEDNPTTIEHSEVLFTADVSDGYPGASEVLTWSKISPSGAQTAFSPESYVSPSSVSLVADEAGEWTVILLVRDSAGHLTRSTSTITVENQAPVAVLILNGLLISDGDSVVLPSGQSWALNASQSTDTANDLDGLRYTWYLDDKIIQSGGAILLPESINASGSQTLRLSVTDDDGTVSEMSFTMDLQDDQMGGSEGLLGGNFFTLALIAVIFLSILLMVRMGSNSTTDSLPKWQRPKDE